MADRPTLDIDEHAELVAWRLKQLLDQGVVREEAENLAARLEVDLALLRKLCRRGCPLDTALRIVA